jgi:hypothetical protein
MNAREFVLQQAKTLREYGNEVTIRDEGNRIHVWSESKDTWGTSIGIRAFRNGITGRWNFAGASFYTRGQKDFERKTYARVRTAVMIYGN